MSIQSMLRRGLTFSSTNNHLTKSVLSGFRGRRPYANNANAAAAEEPNPDGNKIRGRKLPRKEREALVESFVHEYRAMNAGKFPTPSYAHKQVGGCYYRVRRILQELQYTAKMSPSCGGAEHLSGQEKIGVSAFLTEVEEDSTREMSAGASVGNISEAKNDAGLSDASDRLLESKILSEEVITPGSGSGLVDTQSNVGKEESGEPSDMGSDKLDNGIEELKQKQSDAIAPRCEMLQEGLEVVSHLCDKSENSEAEEAQADRLDTQSNVGKEESGEASDIGSDKLDNGMEELKQNQSDAIAPRCEMLQEGLEVSHSCDKSENSEAEEAQADRLDTEDVSKPQTNEISKDLPCRPADDAEPPKRSTLWGTMKSFANGIVSIFRNQ